MARIKTMNVEFEIGFEDNHWNENCGCMIPAAWVAWVEVDGERQPKWPCGTTRQEAVAAVLREYPDARELAG